MKKKLLLVLLITINLSGCDKNYGITGPLDSYFDGFWKLREMQGVDGKITLPSTPMYFYRRWYGDINIGKSTPLAKDSIIFYRDKTPIMATAFKQSLEQNKKDRKTIFLLENGKYISMKFFTDQPDTDRFIEVIRANTLDSLSKSPIERYKSAGVERVW